MASLGLSFSLLSVFPSKLTHLGMSYNLWSHSQLLYVHLAKKWLKEIKRRMILFDTWKLYEILTSVSINKVSLEQSHIHSFIYYLQLLLHDNYN